jgi:uncharacterized protein
MNSGIRSLEAISFGAGDRRLFGVVHRPSAAAPVRPAVLLCNAFGQERIRAHRMTRVLAERLVRHGHAVLRFDYFATGDSMGDDAQVDLSGWQSDVLTADAELRLRSGAARTIWIGMRLGATVVLRAMDHGPSHLVGAVAWDPILDGPRYLAFLRERHVESLEDAFSVSPRPTPRERAADPACFVDEAIGFALPVAFREQIRALSLQTWRWPTHPGSVCVVCDESTHDGRDASECLTQSGRPIERVDLKHGTEWTTDTADNSALVPATALIKLTQIVADIA